MPHVPPTMGNGGGPPIPPDLVWDEDNHPVIYNCSQHTNHAHNCDRNCGEPTELDSESQVELLNEGRRYARLGIPFVGIPAAYFGKIPIPGLAVELVDLLMWLEATKELLVHHLGVTEFELEELYREKKINFLRDIRETNEKRIKKQQIAAQLAVARKGLLGPDGNPIQ